MEQGTTLKICQVTIIRKENQHFPSSEENNFKENPDINTHGNPNPDVNLLNCKHNQAVEVNK